MNQDNAVAEALEVRVTSWKTWTSVTFSGARIGVSMPHLDVDADISVPGVLIADISEVGEGQYELLLIDEHVDGLKRDIVEPAIIAALKAQRVDEGGVS